MAGECRLMPRDPTPEMVEAMKAALHDWREGLDSDERMLRHTLRNGKPFHCASDDEKHAIRWRAAWDAASAHNARMGVEGIPPNPLKSGAVGED